MDFETMQKIVDGAPSWAVWFDPKLNDYGDDEWDHVEGFISIDDLIHIPTARLELAKHDTLDLEPADIPHGTIVWRGKVVSEKVLDALRPPTYEKINELRIAAEKENAILKAELIKTKHEHSLFNERVKDEVRVQANKIHYQYERDKAIRENVEDALHLVESQLRCMNCLDVVGSSRAGIEFDRLKIKRNLLIELLTVEDEE